MKRTTLIMTALLGMFCFAQEIRPRWELALNGGDLDAIVSTGTQRFLVKATGAEKLEWGPGRLGGKALYFKNDVNCKEKPMGTLAIPAEEHFDFSQPFTMMCWFRPDPKLRGNMQYTIFGNTPSDYGPGFRLIYGWGAIRVTMGQGSAGKGGGFVAPASKLKVALGTWNHIAIRNDGNRVSIFYNGIEVASTERKIFPAKPRPFHIGTYNGYAYCYSGAISEFKMFDQALDAEQILRIAKELD